MAALNDVQTAFVMCRIRELQLELATAQFRERIARKLRNAYMKRCRMLEDRASAAPADSGGGLLCAVCMANPLRFGFVHASGTLHINLCETCAGAAAWPKCPTCREPGSLAKVFCHGVPSHQIKETHL